MSGTANVGRGFWASVERSLGSSLPDAQLLRDLAPGAPLCAKKGHSGSVHGDSRASRSLACCPSFFRVGVHERDNETLLRFLRVLDRRTDPSSSCLCRIAHSIHLKHLASRLILPYRCG